MFCVVALLSRGQLGHGAVDSQEKPKMVENLAGLKMVSVAAGGWHSVSISGDHM